MLAHGIINAINAPSSAATSDSPNDIHAVADLDSFPERYKDAVWVMHCNAAARTWTGLGMVCYQLACTLLITCWTAEANFYTPAEIFHNALVAYYIFLTMLMTGRQRHATTLASLFQIVQVNYV